MLKIKTGCSESLILELKLATFLPQRHFVSFQRVFTRTVFCSKKEDFDLCRKQEDACVCRREQLSGQVAENPRLSNTNFFSVRIKHPFLTYFASLIFWKSAPSDVMEGLIHHWQSPLVTDYTFSQLFTPPFEAEWPYLYSFGLFSSGGRHSESTASIQLHPLHPPIKQSIMWIWILSYMLSIRQWVICTLKLVMHMFKDGDEKLHQRVKCQTDNEADPHQNYQSAKNWPACLTFLEMNFLNFPLSRIPWVKHF